MPERIISVGFQIPGGEVEYFDYDEKISLLDWDIIVFSMDLLDSFSYGSTKYNGKTCLSDDDSFNYIEARDHWHKEIEEAYQNGKSIFIILDEKKQLYVATGQRKYSGTGRNQTTTRIVTEVDNYQLLPLKIEVTNAVGKQMSLNTKLQYLKNYWTSFSKDSCYKVTFTCKEIQPLILTKSGNKYTGGIKSSKESNGFILLLPYIDLNQEVFTSIRGDKEYWSKRGEAYGKLFVSTLVNVSKTIKACSGKTPQPVWIFEDEYQLPIEVEIRKKLLIQEKKLETIQNNILKIKDILSAEISIKDLLFEQGKPLEYAIMKVLQILGFETSQYKQNDSEFDVVFQCPEGRLIGEAEGKDNKPINIEKLRQLDMNINEDFSRDEIEKIAKGVLFGNAYRLLPIMERKDYFTEKCIIAAKRSNIALVKTHELYSIVLNHQNLTVDDKTKIRKLLLNSSGIIDLSVYFSKHKIKECET